MRIAIVKEDHEVFLLTPSIWFSWANRQYILWFGFLRFNVMWELWGKKKAVAEEYVDAM